MFLFITCVFGFLIFLSYNKDSEFCKIITIYFMIKLRQKIQNSSLGGGNEIKIIFDYWHCCFK
jgi:hypothetical protein